MAEIEVVDLRHLRGRDALYNQQLREMVLAEVKMYGVSVDFLDPQSHILHISGERAVSIKGKSRVKYQEEEWDVGEYLKLARQYARNYERIQRVRERENLTAYGQEPLAGLIYQRSDAKQYDKGLRNAVETQKKILSRNKETGLSPLNEAVKNVVELRELKTKAFDNPDEFFTKEELKYYKKPNGEFKSKKREREYYQEFSSKVVENYEEYEGEFFGWAQSIMDTSKEPFKAQFGRLSKEQKQDLVNEYTRYKLGNIIDAEGSLEAEDFRIDESEALELMRKVRKETNTRRKR